MKEVTVTAAVRFFINGSYCVPGMKLTVTEERAQYLADKGLIKSIIKPMIDKMVKAPKRRK